MPTPMDFLLTKFQAMKKEIGEIPLANTSGFATRQFAEHFNSALKKQLKFYQMRRIFYPNQLPLSLMLPEFLMHLMQTISI